MRAVKFGVVVVVVALSGKFASAQPPVWAGGATPPSQLFGYSPLVPTVDPFPTRTSGYAPSIFGPNGGRRVYPPLVVNPRRPASVFIEVRDGPRVPTGTNLASTASVMTAAAFEPAGPVVRPLPVQGVHRFDR